MKQQDSSLAKRKRPGESPGVSDYIIGDIPSPGAGSIIMGGGGGGGGGALGIGVARAGAGALRAFLAGLDAFRAAFFLPFLAAFFPPFFFDVFFAFFFERFLAMR